MKPTLRPTASRQDRFPIAWSSLRLPALHLELETMIYFVVNALDVVLTYLLLTHDKFEFIEANPVARYFLYSWGAKGLVWFKVSLVAIVTLNCQIIARKRPDIARRVLFLAIAIVSAVVIYSGYLFVRHSS
jgi:hypothetical protein